MSTTNFDKQIVADIIFVRSILPSSYKVGESNKLGSIHCVSEIGIENERQWGGTFKAIQKHFRERFQEVFHNTCTNHVDFIIYLKLNK